MSANVIIIGSGIGGLCLGHGLKKYNIPFHIYERDPLWDHRPQGYRIHVAEQGASALRYLLDETTWRLFELTCARNVMRPPPEIDAVTAHVIPPVLDGTSNTIARISSAKAYSVDRAMLRKILVRTLKDHITWGKAFENYEIENTSVSARFSDGTVISGSLLVGADGAHSVVRCQLLPNLPILDLGACYVYGRSLLKPDLIGALEPTITAGGVLGLKDRSCDPYITMIVEPMVFEGKNEMLEEGFKAPDDYLYWALVTRPKALGIDASVIPDLSAQDCADLALKLTSNWNPKTRAIIECQKAEQTAIIAIRSVALHLDIWEANARVTLIGDAVHLMAPAGGSGAITALRDAELLCRLLKEEGQGRETIQRYENLMREYAVESVRTSWTAANHVCDQRPGKDRHLGEVMIAARFGKIE